MGWKKHMFLTTTRSGIPKYKESYLVSFVDKYCAVIEVSVKRANEGILTLRISIN